MGEGWAPAGWVGKPRADEPGKRFPSRAAWQCVPACDAHCHSPCHTSAPAAAAARWATLRAELLATPHGRERLLAGRPRIHGVPWIEEQAAAIREGPGRRQSPHHRGHEKRRHAKAAPSQQGPQVEVAAAAGPTAAVPPEHGVPASPFAAVAGAVPGVSGGGGQQLPHAQAQVQAPAAAAAYERQGTRYFTPPASPLGSTASELLQDAAAGASAATQPAKAAAAAPEGGGSVGGDGGSRAGSSTSAYSADRSSSEESEVGGVAWGCW